MPNKIGVVPLRWEDDDQSNVCLMTLLQFTCHSGYQTLVILPQNNYRFGLEKWFMIKLLVIRKTPIKYIEQEIQTHMKKKSKWA